MVNREREFAELLGRLNAAGCTAMMCLIAGLLIADGKPGAGPVRERLAASGQEEKLEALRLLREYQGVAPECRKGLEAGIALLCQTMQAKAS